MKLIIDLLGADLGQQEVLEGIVNSLSNTKLNFVLVGESDKAKAFLKDKNVDFSRFEFIDTNETITNEDDPARSLRRKPNASQVLGLKRLNEDGDGFLSAGSTGALIAGGIFITKRLENVDRATLATFIPNQKGGVSVIADSGAVVDAKPEMINQFATMASIAASKYLKKENPTVYLINVGVEEGKGDNRSKEAYELLKNNPNINFCGNMEARDFLTGKADVIVGDGFAGNMLIKSGEGVASVLFGEIKEKVKQSFLSKIGGLLLKKSLLEVKEKYDYNKIGAAIILGLTKPLFKAHGSSSKVSIEHAIYKAEEFLNAKINEHLEGKL